MGPIFFYLNHKLASIFGTICTKIHFLTDCPKKDPFLGGKKSTETTVKPRYDIRDPHNWTHWVLFYWNYMLASRFRTIGRKIHILTDFPKKRPFFRRKKSTETPVKPPYDIRGPRNWTLWFFFNLNYKLASRFGTIGTKIHFLTICLKNPRKPLLNKKLTTWTPLIGCYWSSLTKMQVSIKAGRKLPF